MVPESYTRAPFCVYNGALNHIALSRRPIERFGNSRGAPHDGAVLDRDGNAGGYRSKARRAEQDAALDHRLPRFGHRRHAKLHSARDRAARSTAAADGCGSLPRFPSRENPTVSRRNRTRRPAREKTRRRRPWLRLPIHEMRGVGARLCRIGKRPQVGAAPVERRRHRPVELRRRRQVIIRTERRLEYLRSRGRRSKLRRSHAREMAAPASRAASSRSRDRWS